jgi:hypothetical protein
MKMWRYLLINGVDVYPVNPRLKISLLHRRTFSKLMLLTTYTDCECNAKYPILRVSLASGLAPGKNALESF